MQLEPVVVEVETVISVGRVDTWLVTAQTHLKVSHSDIVICNIHAICRENKFNFLPVRFKSHIYIIEWVPKLASKTGITHASIYMPIVSKESSVLPGWLVSYRMVAKKMFSNLKGTHKKIFTTPIVKLSNLKGTRLKQCCWTSMIVL